MSSLQLYLLVGFQRLKWTFLDGTSADVDLYGLCALTGIGVLHRHAYLIILISGFAAIKGGIAQTIADGEKCSALLVAVGAVHTGVVQEVGQLVSALIERDWQFAAGIVVAKEHVVQSATALFTVIPPLYDGIA